MALRMYQPQTVEHSTAIGRTRVHGRNYRSCTFLRKSVILCSGRTRIFYLPEPTFFVKRSRLIRNAQFVDRTVKRLDIFCGNVHWHVMFGQSYMESCKSVGRLTKFLSLTSKMVEKLDLKLWATVGMVYLECYKLVSL